MASSDFTGRRQRLLACAAVACFGLPGVLALPARAEEVPSVGDLGRLSLEELSEVQVTSVSKHNEPLSRAPAAVYVITSEDIRRSGAVNLAEALRLAPNLDVERLNTASYTVTARGFNSPESANKLLVLIDGRSVYTPLASTVFWESLGVVLADIDRIEVISGPGGTLWGANAVNGVINVITRKAGDTQGLLANTGIGGADGLASLRYGGKLGETAAFRIYGQYRSADLGGTGSLEANAPSDAAQAGFRFDNETGRDTLTLQGDIYRNSTDLLDQTLSGGNILGRWDRQLANGSTLEVQAYYDQADRSYLVAADSLKTLDLQAQQTLSFGERHKIVWGGEYRLWRSEFDSFVGLSFLQPESSLSLGNLFAQDEIELRPDLTLTLGMKLEDNSYSGLDYLPTARLAWQLSDKTLLWSAVSRAVRTPSRIDRELQGGGILAPSPDFGSEKLVAYELGYRAQPTANISLSISGFYNVYDDLRTAELSPSGGFPGQISNSLEGDTYGVEAWAKYAVTPWWRLSAGVSTLEKNLHVKAGHIDLSHMQEAGQDPPYHATLRSEMNISDRLELDGSLRGVGHVSPSNVPAYIEADARIGWRLTDALQVSIDGFNLLHAEHLEVIDPATAPARAIPRSVFLSLRWEH
jgi:iron complex outermembrane receptor protein